MAQADDQDRVPPEDAKRAHTMAPAEGARDPAKYDDEQRPPHPVDPAEGPRKSPVDESSKSSQ